MAGSANCRAPDPRRFLCAIPVIFACGAEVAAVLTLEQLKGVFLGGGACVANPFIPGVR